MNIFFPATSVIKESFKVQFRPFQFGVAAVMTLTRTLMRAIGSQPSRLSHLHRQFAAGG
jgi:hypothetical protein